MKRYRSSAQWPLSGRLRLFSARTLYVCSPPFCDIHPGTQRKPRPLKWLPARFRTRVQSPLRETLSALLGQMISRQGTRTAGAVKGER
jgi:hypothetical protein